MDNYVAVPLCTMWFVNSKSFTSDLMGWEWEMGNGKSSLLFSAALSLPLHDMASGNRFEVVAESSCISYLLGGWYHGKGREWSCTGSERK